MIELDRSEAIRYMGYHGTQPDEAVQASLTRCGEALQQAAEPKSIYRVFPLQHIDAQTTRDRRCTNSQQKSGTQSAGLQRGLSDGSNARHRTGSPDCPRVLQFG